MATDRTFELAVRQCRAAVRSRRVTTPSQLSRTFSTTPSHQRHGDIPTFTESSTTPDLNALLASVRTRIFLPAHLRTAQRNLIFRTRNHSLLTNEPLMIEIGSETVQLQPLDITKDIPNSWGSVVQAMSLMGTSRADWANLPSLLEGMKTAGRRWQVWQLEKVVREAGKAGMSAVVVECVRAAGRTGLVLRDVRVVREAMWACRTRAVMSGWDRGETARALRNAEQIAEALEGDAHWGGSKRPEGVDPRRQADVLGVLVELAAQRAVRYQDGKDVDGKVEMYVKRLVSNLEGVGAQAASESTKTPWAATADYELLRWVPARNGLRAARDVLDDGMPQSSLVSESLQKLESTLKDASDIVTGARDDVREKRRGLTWLNESE